MILPREHRDRRDTADDSEKLRDADRADIQAVRAQALDPCAAGAVPWKLVWGTLVMNLENHTVTKSGEIIELTAKEFDILRLLMENPRRVYTKAQIYSLIWNDAYMGDENAVNVHISRLRTKIEDDPRKPQVVITVWGIGYKLGEQK